MIPKNHGLWLSELTNRGIRQNFLLKNGCGVNVKGNIKTPNWNLISYCWKSSGIIITTFLTPPKKIISRIKLRMRNPRKIYIRYVINCWTVNRDQCCFHKIALHHWLIPSLISSKIKLNWFAATLKNIWIHLLINYHPLPPYFMDYLLNSSELFLNLMSGKKLHHPLQNFVLLTPFLHGY